MSALPATVCGLFVYVTVNTVRQALALTELSGSDTVVITISLERLVTMAQTVAFLVGKQWMKMLVKRCRPIWKLVLDLGIGAAASLVLCARGRRYLSVGTDFCFRMPVLRRLDEEVDRLMGSDVPTIRGTSKGALEKKGVREATASAALPVKAVTAEVRRVTLKRSSVSLESRGSKKRKSFVDAPSFCVFMHNFIFN